MGSGASKAGAASSKGAAAATASSFAARRVYPTRAPGATPTSNAAPTATPPASLPSSSTVTAETLAPRVAATSRPTPEVSLEPHKHPQTRASVTRPTAIDLDARDPDFASRLSQLGPVRHPAPTFSSSSTAHQLPAQTNQHVGPSSSANTGIFPTPGQNPAITILNARQRIADAVEAEKQATGRRDFQGRQFADVATLRKALVLRDEQGMSEAQVERALGLRQGTVAALGGVGTVEAV